MLNDEDYAEMIRKYKRNELSPTERQLFDQIRDTPEFKRQLEQFTLLQDLSRIEALREEAQSLIAEVMETDSYIQPSKDIIKIVVVSDHNLFRDGLVNLINHFPGCDVIWEAENRKVLNQKIASEANPHIVLLDINTTLMDGFETALWLREYNPAIKVLVMTMHDDERTSLKMYKAGVRGVILKTTGGSELQIAINDVMSKGFYTSKAEMEPLSQITMHQKKLVREDKVSEQVSKREAEILRLVAQGYSSAEIADRLFLSTSTVNTHQRNLRKKFGLKNRFNLVAFALSNGLVE